MKQKAGFIGILGRPNVGKSTLLNNLLGKKISITSRKAQTTRNRILGIRTQDSSQAIFVDTPGIFSNPQRKLNEKMISSALQSLQFVDVIIFVIDARYWREEDEYVFKKIAASGVPIILVLNKMDRMLNQDNLLPELKKFQQRFEEAAIEKFDLVPISAKTGQNVEHLWRVLEGYLPENQHIYNPDELTDKSEKFLIAEIIREKILRLLGEEVPHDVMVEIEHFKTQKKVIDISAIIWVNRPGQKKIIIGINGDKIKQLGILARRDIERLLSHKIMLRLWVKVKKNWADDERALKSLGFDDEI